MSPATFELPDPWRGYFGNSYATYHLSFERFPSCVPINDAVLDAPDARKVMDDLLGLSNIDGPLAGRRERYAVAWADRSTGAVRFEISPREGNRCDVDVVVPPDTPDEKVLGIVHTHPHFRKDNMTGCDPEAAPYRPEANGGGSDEDWDLAKHYGVDVYSVSPEMIHRLPWHTSLKDRKRNAIKWKRKVGECPSRP